MIRRILKNLIFLSVFFIQVISSLKCGDEEIANCLECATGDDEIGTCAKCEDNYFQFLYNYLCLPCDHETYGDIGCQKFAEEMKIVFLNVTSSDAKKVFIV